MNYKLLLIIPIILLLSSAGILVHKYLTTGEWFERSVELTGGDLLTVSLKTPVNLEQIEKDLSPLGDFSFRQSSGFSGYTLFIETKELEEDKVLEKLNSLGISTESYAIREIGASLGSSFWSQVQIGIIAAIILIGIVLFILFRAIVPAVASTITAAADILITLAVMQVLHIELSLASFAALLMLLGYSVDSDVLLTSRILKGEAEEETKKRAKSGFVTGITMTLVVVAVLYISQISIVLSEIAAVLLIGLIVDIVMTWAQDMPLVRWYTEKKESIHA